MTDDCHLWYGTTVPGVLVHTAGETTSVQLLGWDGILPPSVVQAVVARTMPVCGPPGGRAGACPGPAPGTGGHNGDG
ncbi:hypothetical protein [Streptomyces sp. AS58]|uniref:hypothetical protein n=1 Tax=Streptomyces sp. AS58 TaxID=1519489 RepID=UPI000B10745E|nr:hypothetical protein [Streptomyces sp. AS58]